MLTHSTLAELGRQRWLLFVLAEFARRGGARFVELLRAIGLPRDSLARSIEFATEAGWIGPNPGHGHPLRPEYILLEEGKELAQVCVWIDAQLEQLGLAPQDLTRWTLPVLRTLSDGRERFNELARDNAPITPRALSNTLQSLVANDLVDRIVEDAYPPVSRYRLTSRGVALTT